ncbi:MAG: glyoxalase/bleomycin resistance/dioxygenase family protein [Pirellulales bacterium]|nr:glyoxalase/bleomycin resistance/dioxygenase family protein [Pirellulales bacterium]
MSRKAWTTVAVAGAWALAVATGGFGNHAPAPAMRLRLELFVADLDASAAFYADVLGFEQLEAQANYQPIRAGSVEIGLGLRSGLSKTHYFNPELQTSRVGLGTEIVLEVEDVRATFERVQKSGKARILAPLFNRPWGATDFRIADPDGYYLRITSATPKES